MGGNHEQTFLQRSHTDRLVIGRRWKAHHVILEFDFLKNIFTIFTVYYSHRRSQYVIYIWLCMLKQFEGWSELFKKQGMGHLVGSVS